MTERHKNADVIIAFAEGKEIQNKYKTSSNWFDWDSEMADTFPNFDRNDLEWRIKPTKKKGWINIYSAYPGVEYQFNNTKEDADMRAGNNSNRSACIEIEYEEGQGL